MLRSVCLVVSLLVTSLFLLSGCDSLRKEVDPDRLNREASKLVVTCFLSPQDTVLAVKVTRSQPVLGDEIRNIYNGITVPNATVSLSASGKSVMLRYNSQLGYYGVSSQQLPIVAAQTYTLSVQTPSGEQAMSTCTIPGAINLTSITVDSAQDNRFGSQGRRFFVRARWQDPVESTNFYQVRGQFQYVGKCTNCPNNQPEREESGSVYFDEGIGSATYLNDRNSNGEQMISPRAYITGWGNYVYLGGPQGGAFGGLKSAKVLIDLLSTDQAYYQYQDAVARQSQASDNPFAEPVPVPTNIQGGLGCFAGYNRSTMTLKLK